MDRMVNKEQTPKPNEGFQLHRPELLIAAAHGDSDEIKRLLLLHREEDTVEVILNVEETDIEDTTTDIEDIVADNVKKPAPSAIPPSEAVTGAGDSVLHVVASSGDGVEFLKCATMIVGEANHLLSTPNRKGDSPLHCAARFGNARMVSHLLALATPGDGTSDDERVKAILRMQNHKEETVLHEAVRLKDKDMIHKLLSADSQLARVPLTDGASPLYLALSLAHRDIAQLLFEKDKELSYSGPDGQNALHAAIQWKWGEEATKVLLERNKDVIKQVDRSTGSTPLHVAAKRGAPMGLLLEAYPAAAYLPDSNGSFPIHLAASNGNTRNVMVLLLQKKRSDSDSSKKEKSGPGDSSKEEKKKSAPYCAQLRDGNGRTFLHVVVQHASLGLVYYALQELRKMFASSVMNMQDNDGNTALHLAVELGNIRIVRALVSIPEVNLYLSNNKGETPRELASITYRGVEINRGFLDPRFRIYRLLDDVAVWTDSPRENILPTEIHNNEKGISQDIMDRTQIIGLGSVLVSTVTFAAAFAMPGGYRADGTPLLAGKYAFDAFVMANTLAFIFSTGSTVLLMVAGLTAELVIQLRIITLLGSELFLACSVRSLGAAFAFGMYAVLAPVERNKAIVCCSFTVFALLAMESVWGVGAVETLLYYDQLVLVRRFGHRAWWRLAGIVLVTLMLQLCPYIIIPLSALK